MKFFLANGHLVQWPAALLHFGGERQNSPGRSAWTYSCRLAGGPVWTFRRVAAARSGGDEGQPSSVPPVGRGGVASCIQIVIRSKTFFLKHPKSRTSPVPNFFHTVVEDFWYWGRSNVLLMFCLKSFSKVKFYNSSPMYIRYTVIIMTSAHHPAKKHTSPHTPQQQTNPFITPNKSIFWPASHSASFTHSSCADLQLMFNTSPPYHPCSSSCSFSNVWFRQTLLMHAFINNIWHLIYINKISAVSLKLTSFRALWRKKKKKLLIFSLFMCTQPWPAKKSAKI